MTTEAKQLSGEPIAIVTMYDPVDPVKDVEAEIAIMKQVLESTQGDTYTIADMTHLKNVTLDDFIDGMAVATRQYGSVIGDPRSHFCVVTADDLTKFAAGSLTQKQYGSLNVSVFSSVDEALAHARAELAKAR